MSKKFVLKRNHTELFRFDVGDQCLSEFEKADGFAFSELPPIIKVGGDLDSFFAVRFPRFDERYADFFGMKFEGLEDVLEKTAALSLFDDFWIDRVDSLLEWDEVCLWANEWDDRVGSALLNGDSLEGMSCVPSPEFTAPKIKFRTCWREIDGAFWYVVRGNPELAYVKQIADFVGIEFPEIRLGEGDELLCKPIFESGRGFVCFTRVSEIMFLPWLGAVVGLGDLGKFAGLLKMIVFDNLVSGGVRNPYFIGVGQDRTTFEFVGALSFLCGDQRLVSGEKSLWLGHFGMEWFSTVSGDLGFDFIEKFKDFKFELIEGCDVSEKRLKLAESLIKKKAATFLEMMNV
jgi:hypothetical protein